MKTQTTSTPSVAETLFKGITVGLAATQALDLMSEYLYDHMSESDRDAEESTRSHRQAYEVAVARMAKLFGRTLTKEEEQRWGWRFHKAFGIMGGIQYVMLRKKYPKLGAGMGLVYGFTFFLLADEFMLYVLKLTPGPTQFRPASHARGAIAHVAYGVAAEAMARSLDSAPKLLIREDRAYLLQ